MCWRCLSFCAGFKWFNTEYYKYILTNQESFLIMSAIIFIMKQKRNLLVAFALIGVLISINSCDIIKPPYEEENGGSGPDTTTYVRKILVEDYTGHICPNCPLAAAALKQLETDYPHQVVAIAPHVSTLADPGPQTSIWYYNFKTPCGDAWDAEFKVSLQGLPKGMVNRKGYPSANVIEFSIWDDSVASIVNVPADAVIEISNTYNSANNTVETTVTSKFVNELQGNYYLSVVYTEDSIVQPQVLPPGSPHPIDTFYVHMHALRGDINGTWGEQIASNPAENFEVAKTYSKQLKSDAVPANCKVVAFIYKEGTYEVIQAEEKHIE